MPLTPAFNWFCTTVRDTPQQLHWRAVLPLHRLRTLLTACMPVLLPLPNIALYTASHLPAAWDLGLTPGCAFVDSAGSAFPRSRSRLYTRTAYNTTERTHNTHGSPRNAHCCHHVLLTQPSSAHTPPLPPSATDSQRGRGHLLIMVTGSCQQRLRPL